MAKPVRIHITHRWSKDYTSKVEITTTEIVTEVVDSIGDEETSQQTSTGYKESV